MAIVEADIVWRLSGGAGNADPQASLGGVISSTAWVGGTLHDLFDAVSGDDNAASDVEYRCVYLLNNHGSLTWQTVVGWIVSQVSGGALGAIGLDPAGVGNGSTAGVADTIADEDEAPAGVTFSAPTSKGAGLAVSDVDAGEAFAVWFRRTAADTAALDDDGMVVRFEGDTAA